MALGLGFFWGVQGFGFRVLEGFSGSAKFWGLRAEDLGFRGPFQVPLSLGFRA